MKRLFLISILTFAIGCSNDDEILSNTLEILPNTLQIRVKNSSSFQYSDIKINTGGGENNYGNVLTTQFSDYKSFRSAYRYAYIELKIQGETFILQPTDYVGETPLSLGKYTYDITASEIGETYGRLSLTLIED